MLNSFFKSFLVYGLITGISKSLNILLLPFYGHYFSSHDYAIIDLCISFTALMVIINSFQLESSVARFFYTFEQENKYSLISTAVWSIFTISILQSILLFIFSSFIERLWFDMKGADGLFLLLIIITPLQCFFNFFTLLLRFDQKTNLYFWVVLIQVIVTGCMTIFFTIYTESGVFSVFYAQLSGFGVSILLLLGYLKKYIRLIWSKKIFRDIFLYAYPMVPSVAMGWASIYLSRFLLLYYLSLSEIGVLSIVSRFASIFSLFEMVLGLAWSPFFWKTYQNEKLHPLYNLVFRLLAIVVFFGISFLSIFSKELMDFLFSSDYQQASNLLGLLTLAYAMPMFLQFIGMGPAIVKKTYYLSLIQIIGLIINLMLLFLLLEWLSLLGVVIAVLIANLFVVTTSWVISENLYHQLIFEKKTFVFQFLITLLVIILQLVFELPFMVRILIMLTLLIMGAVFIKKMNILQFKSILNSTKL